MYGMSNKLEFLTLEEAESMRMENKDGKLYRESKIDVKDGIMLLLTSIDHQKSVVSRTLMQKEVFLLYEIVLKNLGLSKGASEDAGYLAYKYGPYSFNVNVALSTLIFSGKIKVDNYYHREEDNKKSSKSIFQKKFLTYFETNESFENIVVKYKKMLSSNYIEIDQFKDHLANKKRAWDQSGYRGIRNLIIDMKLTSGFFSDSKLKDVKPEIFFGRITEDYIPKVRKRFQ